MRTPEDVRHYLASQSPQSFEWRAWQPVDHAVLVFVQDPETDRVLLIHKKRGLGKGMINGPGGKLEQGESYDEAAVRETREEVGIAIRDPEAAARLSFVFADGYSLEVVAFRATRFEGTPHETDEADPFWCTTDDIPFARMWADDRLWLPSVLSGGYVRGRFVFREEEMLHAEVQASPADEILTPPVADGPASVC